MHQNCYDLAGRLIKKYLTGDKYNIADIGSYDVNGTLKPLLEQWDYTGLDIVTGPNVDRVVHPYDFGKDEFDVIVTANCMEHVEDLKAWSRAVMKLLQKGGVFIAITPFEIHEHRYPVDCWRVLPDGMRFLFKEMEILETAIEGIDTYLVARKI